MRIRFAYWSKCMFMLMLSNTNYYHGKMYNCICHKLSKSSMSILNNIHYKRKVNFIVLKLINCHSFASIILLYPWKQRCIISKSYCKMMQDTKYSTVIFKEQNMVNNIHAFFFIYVNKNFSVKYKYLQKPGHRQHCWPEHWQWHCGRRDSGWSLHWETSTVWYCRGRLRQRCTYKKDYEFCLVNTMLCIKSWAYILKGNWNGL